jgi:hypothetical protein
MYGRLSQHSSGTNWIPRPSKAYESIQKGILLEKSRVRAMHYPPERHHLACMENRVSPFLLHCEIRFAQF